MKSTKFSFNWEVGIALQATYFNKKDTTTVPVKITNGVTGITVSGQTPNEVIKISLEPQDLMGKVH